MPDFSLFDNPIVWRKRQLDDEPMPINFQGNILPPFFDAKRFTTQLTTPARGRYNPVLTILGESSRPCTPSSSSMVWYGKCRFI